MSATIADNWTAPHCQTSHLTTSERMTHATVVTCGKKARCTIFLNGAKPYFSGHRSRWFDAEADARKWGREQLRIVTGVAP